MASTFISLTNTLLRRMNEVEITQSEFAAARGVQAMAKDAIIASVEHINQASFTWPFNAMLGEQILEVGTEEYTFPTNLKLPNWRSFHISKDDNLNVRSTPLKFVTRDIYQKTMKDFDDEAGEEGRSVPYYVYPAYNRGFGVSPSPDKAYKVTYEYWKNVVTMTVYNDVCNIPTNYDEITMQGALYHFYMFRDNSDQADRADAMFKTQLTNMKTLLINDKLDTMSAKRYFSRGSSYDSGVNSASVDGFLWVL